VLSALPMAFVGIMSLILFPKAEYDLRLVVGAILFSGALIGRCILDAVSRPAADAQPVEAAGAASRRG